MNKSANYNAIMYPVSCEQNEMFLTRNTFFYQKNAFLERHFKSVSESKGKGILYQTVILRGTQKCLKKLKIMKLNTTVNISKKLVLAQR